MTLASVTLLLACGAGAAEAQQRLLVRKDAAAMTKAEKRAYVRAVLRLKAVRSPFDRRYSYYDQFVEWHRALSRCTPGEPMMVGHFGPMFLPWHRSFVLAFEHALRRVSGKRIAVPYWDWSSRRSTRAVFSRALMGPDGDPKEGNAVTRGPFRKGRWRLRVHPIGGEAPARSDWIIRNFGALPQYRLGTTADVAQALRATAFDTSPFDRHSDPATSFRVAIEGLNLPPGSPDQECKDGVLTTPPPSGQTLLLHAAGHGWVGGTGKVGERIVLGTMAPTSASPNDPVFFLHHANVDRLWAKWQQEHGVRTYAPESGLPENNIDDPMVPLTGIGLPETPRGVENTTALGYRYDDVPPPTPGARAARAGLLCRPGDV